MTIQRPHASSRVAFTAPKRSNWPYWDNVLRDTSLLSPKFTLMERVAAEFGVPMRLLRQSCRKPTRSGIPGSFGLRSDHGITRPLQHGGRLPRWRVAL